MSRFCGRDSSNWNNNRRDNRKDDCRNDFRDDRHHDRKDDCCCAHTLAEELKKFRGMTITVFEKGFMVTGEVVAVKDKQVLVLKNAMKWITTTAEPVMVLPLGQQEACPCPPQVNQVTAFINICNILEFTSPAVEPTDIAPGDGGE